MSYARNAGFNFLGAAAPAVLSVVTIPFIVAQLGTTDFGLLALITAIVGYFAFLDVNLTAGSTKFVAQFRSSGDEDSLHRTVTFGLAFYVALGVVGAVLLFALAGVLVSRVFTVAPERQEVAVLAVQVASAGFLLGQLQSYLQSLPGALMRFDLSGRIEAVFGSLLPLFTVALLALGHGLVEVVWLRVVASLCQVLVLVWLLRGLLPGWRPHWPGAALRGQLIGFSAYAFLSRLSTLTHQHADKLIIGAMVGVGPLAYYVVAGTLSNRVMSLVHRLSGVMLPYASGMAAEGRLEELARHYVHLSRYLFFLNGTIALMLAALAYPLLSLWMGPEFADQGSLVMALVALAYWVDALTHLPSLVNDALGHPQVTGVFSFLRALLSLVLIAGFVHHWGIVGAALGHLVASVLMVSLFMVYVHRKTLPVRLREVVQAYGRPVLLLLPVAAVAWLLSQWAAVSWMRLCTVAAVVALALGAGLWLAILLQPHREVVLRRLGLSHA